MDVHEELLHRFARMIDLPAFLGAQGFELAERTEPARLYMTRASSGETLRLDKNLEGGGWTYANADDPKDRGTVADFLMRREGVNARGCVDRLIACCDERGRVSLEATRYQAFRRAMPDELARACREHEQMKHDELGATKALDRLGIPPGSFDELHFGKVDNEEAVRRLTSEPEVIWASDHRPGDKAVVLVERPIDARSLKLAKPSTDGQAATSRLGRRRRGVASTHPVVSRPRGH